MREPTRTRLNTSRPEVVGGPDARRRFQGRAGRLGERVAEVDGDGVMRGQQGPKMAMNAENEQEEAADDALPGCVQASPHRLGAGCGREYVVGAA